MYKKGRVNSNSRIISTDEDPSLRIESSAIINLRGVSTKLSKYNACSIALCGTENLAPYLRCLTSIELFVNCLFYVKHPILEQQHNKGEFSSIGNAFAMCLSDIALNSLAKEDLSKSVIAEAYSNALNRQGS